MPALFTYDPVYTDGISTEARFPRERYRKVREALAARSVPADIVRSPAVDVDDLLEVHDPAYVARFFEGQLDERACRKIGLRPWTHRIADRTARIIGGSVAAVHALFRERRPVAGNLAGGTHHAFSAEGAGYCVFNDIAVCAKVAMRDHGVGRVLVLDLDVHQGDGTAVIFADDPRVFTASVHCAANFPFRKAQSDLDVALPAGTGDEAFLEAVSRILPDLIDRHRPDLLIYQAGVDGLEEDQLGKWALTRSGLHRRNALVYEAARAQNIPTLVLMGGGYSDPIDASVEALADVFEQAAQTFP